ncbi:MAG: TetR/AcrR family transcriptional regulator [Nevskiales bacterium]|nr:TetR/AcrR family transcriptional regulator [Nevskiales bacterium]
MARPQLSSEEIDAMRRRLTAGALEIYRREGIEAVSLRRLAEHAGISHTLLYRYFSDKAELLAALRAECVRHFDHIVREHEARQSDPVAKIRAIATAYVDFVGAFPDEYLMIFSPHQPAPDRHAELYAARSDLFEHAVGVIQMAIDAKRLHGDARQLTHLFWVSMHGLFTLHAAGQLVHGCGLEDLIQPLVERMLQTPGASVHAVDARRRHPPPST